MNTPTVGPVYLKSREPAAETGCGPGKWLVVVAENFEPTDSYWHLCYMSIGEEEDPRDELDDDVLEQQLANADLIVAAINTVKEVQAMGFDPIAAVEALPGTMRALHRAEEMLRKVSIAIRQQPQSARINETDLLFVHARLLEAMPEIEAALAAARERRGG